ncbi:MAG: hypothetical protein CVU38_12440 [Chloroflexi bacterium HGW-Chloroflexi-1]|nr:MAG: hypothetical protein CVU38_12440 [Chloroflexi bacterium HGW-Chloroflexi-1]
MKAPEPSLEWEITTKCNYRCSYCCQKPFIGKASLEHCSDATVEAVFKLLKELPGRWLVKLIGGEPMIHPRFLEICQFIAASNHDLVITTNFSLPFPRIEQLIQVTGERLTVLTASLHLEEVRDLELFIQKAVTFNQAKHPRTTFVVTSVCLEDKFDNLRAVADRLDRAKIRFAFQVLKVDGKYVGYQNPAVEAYIADKLNDNTATLQSFNSYGTLCHTGELFFRINTSGDAVRCFNAQPLFNLGNVTDGSFRRFESARPCLSQRCTCTVPINRGMIEFGNKADAGQIAVAQIEGRVRDYRRKLTRRIQALSLPD